MDVTVGFIFNKCSRTLLHSTCNVEPQQNIYMAGEENVNHNKNQNKKEDTEKKVGMV